ncbi:MAG TPA: DUF2199 domain-containing protein [Rhizomicrobium sp.]|nr:DUF2199 domain-containing protein [Rhizomicrobium sp.]
MDAKFPTPPFRCSECDEIHHELPDVGYREPAYCFGVPEKEWSQRIHLSSDTCVIDNEHFFVRGVMQFPVLGTSETFNWGVWSTLSKANFDRYVEHYDADLSSWEPMFGWLSNRLPGYSDTLALPLTVRTQQKGKRPLFTSEDAAHPLTQDQRAGITIEKWWEIVGPVLHQGDR